MYIIPRERDFLAQINSSQPGKPANMSKIATDLYELVDNYLKANVIPLAESSDPADQQQASEVAVDCMKALEYSAVACAGIPDNIGGFMKNMEAYADVREKVIKGMLPLMVTSLTTKDLHKDLDTLAMGLSILLVSKVDMLAGGSEKDSAEYAAKIQHTFAQLMSGIFLLTVGMRCHPEWSMTDTYKAGCDLSQKLVDVILEAGNSMAVDGSRN